MSTLKKNWQNSAKKNVSFFYNQLNCAAFAFQIFEASQQALENSNKKNLLSKGTQPLEKTLQISFLLII